MAAATGGTTLLASITGTKWMASTCSGTPPTCFILTMKLLQSMRSHNVNHMLQQAMAVSVSGKVKYSIRFSVCCTHSSPRGWGCTAHMTEVSTYSKSAARNHLVPEYADHSTTSPTFLRRSPWLRSRCLGLRYSHTHTPLPRVSGPWSPLPPLPLPFPLPLALCLSVPPILRSLPLPH